MALFGRKNGGLFADVIRCDEPSYLIWKWRSNGGELGENKRENEIRWGSSLRVKEGEVAAFVYKQKDGTMQDFIVGPFDETIKTKNFPVFSSILGLAFDGKSPFQAEIYFINLANVIQTKFAVPYFDIYDPRFADFGAPVAVRGTITFQITDYRAFIKLHRLDSFSLEDFQKQIKDTVSRYIKDVVANVPSKYNIPLVHIETKTAMINDMVEKELSERLNKDFGVTVSGVDIGAIDIDKSSNGYRQLMAITKDITTATIQAQTAANLENYAETLRIQREEGQYAQRMATRSTNLGAYQTEKQAEIGVAGAEALGKMGENGAGNIDIGGGGAGFNPATLMTSIALGGVVGQNIAGTMGNALSGMNINAQNIVPPPLPVINYHVAVNGHPCGPYNIQTLQQMAQNGQISLESLVWKNGMSGWAKISDIDEIKSLFENLSTPPPIQ
ncbi:MAG: SPFH domain-containing protein [Clostridia bacterium]|nr:SPFH domain-containing protein [Clostridia bacterium]